MLKLEAKHQKIQRSSCTPRWYCKRRFWLLCSIHWTRIISISNDSRQDHGYHLQIARLRWTSSRRSFSFYQSENGRCSQVIQNSKIGVSRHLDSSTTTQMAKIMVQYGRTQSFLLSEICMVILWQDYYGKGNLRKSYWNMDGRKFQIGNVSLFIVGKDYSYLCMWMTWNWLERNKILFRCGKYSIKKLILGEPTSFLDHVYLGCTQRQCEVSQDIVDNYRTMFESRISAGWSREITIPSKSSYFFHGLMIWWVMQRNVWSDCELANKTTQQLYKVSTPCIDDHHFKEEETKSVGELSYVCSQIVLKCWNLARIGRPDTLWSVNKLARSITKWTKACDKRLNRLISHIHHTCECRQYCHVGNTAKQCRLGLFQDSDFAVDLEDSKSTSGGTLCIFGSHTFVPRSWMCTKQTTVSHSSTESDIISLDTGLRLDGLPALELWDLIVSVLGNVSRVSERSVQPDNDVHKHHKSQKNVDVMKDIDAIPSNVQSARQEALLYVFEDNEAVIKMIVKWRSPTMRHVSRTHKVVSSSTSSKLGEEMVRISRSWEICCGRWSIRATW